VTLPQGCSVCQGPLQAFMCRRDVPVHQNVLFADRQAARSMPRGDLDLWSCDACGFTTNLAFDDALLSYGAQYENTQTLSPSFSAHVDDLVRLLIDAGVRSQRVVEVGCGKGEFLRKLCAAGGNYGLGFDPAYGGPDDEGRGRIRYRREMFDHSRSDPPVDAVVCRHVVEHVVEPVRLLRSIRQILKPEGLAFFETPTLEWILRGCVFWDLFYEHCGYFTRVALENLFRISGFSVLDCRTVFQGQYLIILARPAQSPQPLRPVPAGFAENRSAYTRREAERVNGWRRKVDRLLEQGALAVWGAGAKGVTFVNLLDPGASKFACLVDINPAKQGQHAPGTGHRVVAPADLGFSQVKQAVLMNANYLAETRLMVRRLGLDVELLPAS
jgi:SAM-dependent methyltransferase